MTDEPGAEVIQLRNAHTEVAFEEKQDAPAYLDTTDLGGKRRDIIPEPLRRGRLAETLGAWAGKTWHQARWHGVRLPWHAIWLSWLAQRGAWRLTCRLFAWANWAEGWLLESQAVAAGRAGHHEALRAHTEGKKTRAARWRIVAVCAAAAAVLLGGLAGYAPRWWWFPLAAAVFPVLVWHGKPAGRPLISPAILPPAYTVPTPEIITRALGALNIAAITKAIESGAGIEWVSDVHRDGSGWAVELNLPYGVTAKMIIARREQLSSGLRRPLSAVWPEAVPDEHDGRLFLWIGRHDLAKARPPAYPLLRAGQCSIFDPVPFATVPRGLGVSVPLFEANYLIGAAMGNGKALALDTRVPTPSGWTTMGELRDGDMVYGADGRPCKVVKAWPTRHGRPCYEVEFSDGTMITADAEHLWLADSRASRVSAQRALQPKRRKSPFSRDQSHKRILPAVMTTAEMADTQRTKEGWVNYSVRLASPLQAPDAQLPVPPYTLGAWLGDGTTTKGEITTLDPELITEIEAEGETCIRLTSPSCAGKCPQYRIPGLSLRLRQVGVLGNKHIPVSYLRASETQRRALLAGLLDTDGTCSQAGEVTFSVTSERLARDVHHLAASLGYKVGISSRPARLYGKECGTAWKFHFTPDDKVFRLSRKAARQVTKTRFTAGHRYITAIREVPSVPVRCITVDSPDSLYLVSESCVPTHNTAAARVLLAGGALDPLCDLWTHEFSGKGDLEPFAQVSHRYCSGMDDDSVAYGAESAALLRRELERRQKVFQKLPKEAKPDGRLTRELAANRALRLRPILATFDEFQVAIQHPEYGAQIAADIAHVERLGRAYGIMIILATQRPDKDSIPTSITGVTAIRFCLKVPDQVGNDLILGTGSYKAGFNAVVFRHGIDAGLGWLRGTGDPQAVRTYYLDLPASAKICARARAVRQAAGVLSGYALGEDDGQPARDVLADVLSVFRPGEAGLHWQAIADRLAERHPDRWADVTGDALSAQCRDLGVPSVSVKAAGAVLRGCRRADVEAAAEAS